MTILEYTLDKSKGRLSQFWQTSKYASIGASALLMAACGGSSSDEAPQPKKEENLAPQLTILGENQVAEKTALTLTAQATDSDGSIASYKWSHDSELSLVLSGQSSANLSVSSPELAEDTVVVFTLKVTDNDGATTSQQISVTFTDNIENPQVSISSEKFAQERVEHRLTAVAKAYKGDISEFAWTHDSGIPLTLAGEDSANLKVTSPDLSSDLLVNFTLEVADEWGNKAQSTFPVTFKRNTSQLILAGKVTDQPIPKALVSVQLDSGLFTAEADGNGDYSIELTLDESDADKLIKLEAKGQGEFEHVEFISQLGSASELQIAAGEDSTLRAEENFAVNITNVTTAEYALLNDIENAFKNAESLKKSKLEVNAQAKLELATLIKVVVDNQNINLPEGVNNTLDFAKNKQKVDAFLTQLMSEQPELIEKTEQALKNDENLIQPVSFSLKGEYWLAETAFANGLYLGLTFNEDGTGYATGKKDYSFTWQQNEQSVDITFVDELILESSSLFDKDAPQVITHLKLDIYDQNARFKSSTVTITHQRYASSLPDLEEGDESLEDIEEKLKASQVRIQAQLFNPKAMQALSEIEFSGTWSFMHQSEFSDDYIQFEFRNDGTVLDVDEQKEYAYKVDNNILRISHDDETFEYQLVNDFKIWSNLVGYKISEDGKSEFAEVSAVKHQDVSFEAVDYKRTWKAEHYRTQSKFAINADGVYQYLWQEGFQSQLQDGVISRYRYKYGDRRLIDYCDLSNPECEVDRTYSHKLLAVDGNDIVVEFSNVSNDGSYDPYRHITTYTLSDEPLRVDGLDETILVASVDLFHVQEGKVLNLRTTNWCNSRLRYLEDCTRKLSFVDENGWTDYLYEFKEGKLQLTNEDTDEVSFLEIQFTESGAVSVCRYKDGEACNSDNTVTYSFTEPKRNVIANATENGQILLASEQVNYQSSIHFSVIADEGFVIESVTACGEEQYIPEQDLTNYNFYQWLWNDSSVSDCEITATFAPFKPYLGKTLLFDDSFYLPNVLELNVERDGTATGISGANLTHAWEEITESHLSFTPPYSFYEQLSQYFDRGFTSQQQEITSFDIQFEEAEAKVSWQLNSESNDVSLDSVGPVSFKNSKFLEPIAVDELKWVGTWYIIGEKNQKSISLAEDGTGSLRDLNRAYLEPQTLTWSTNEQNQLSLKSDEWGSLDNLELVKGQHGDLILILNESNSFNSDLSLNRGINLFIKHDVDVEQDDLIGRWRFKTGPEQEAYSVLDIRDDLSFEYGGTQGWVTFENSELVLNVFKNDLGHQDNSCTAQRPECVESVHDTFKLMKFDEGLVYFTNQYAGFKSAEITQDFSITQFEKFLFNYSEFFLLQDHGYERISLDDNSIRWFDYYGVELVDGKLITKPREYHEGENPMVFEILSNDMQGLEVCVYFKGESCENGEVQKWFFELPKVTIDLNFNEGGQVQSDTLLENLSYGDYVSISLIPDEGMRVGAFEGCDANIDNTDITYKNITLSSNNITESCQLTVTFIEEDGLSTSDRLGIEDPALKSCVDDMNDHYPEFSDSLSCYGNDISSLRGVENMSRLTSLELSASTLSEQAVADLSSFTQIELLNLSNIITGYFDLSKMSSLNSLHMYGAQIDSIDLPQHEGLKHLYLENTSLSSIDLIGLQGLETLSISGSNIISLDVTDNVNLTELNITYSSVESIEGFSSDHQLTLLDAYGSNLVLLDISPLEYIRTINISETKVKVLDISSNTSLNSLWADNSQLSQLIVSDNEYDELYTLSLENTAMAEIDLSQFTVLTHLNIENASVSKLDLTQNIALNNLRAAANDLVELTVGELPQLTELDLSDNPLERLSITGQLSSLWRLDLSKTSLTSIDLTYMDESLGSILFEGNTLLSVVGLENLTYPANFSLIDTQVSDAIVQEIESYGHYVAK